jgi:hypothetical protein
LVPQDKDMSGSSRNRVSRCYWEYELAPDQKRAKYETSSRWEYQKVSLLLMFRHGFVRWGVWVPGILDDAIFPSFIRGSVRIEAGWDNWSDFYLLASDERSIAFLRRFVNKHCKIDG